MPANYMQHLNPKTVPQSQPLPGSTQVQNSAGGFSWQVDCWTRLDRFLILGAEGGSYYATERAMTLDAAGSVRECFSKDPQRTIARIIEVSDKGLAPKNGPAIFALALLSTNSATLKAVPSICRIGTHVFEFVGAAQQVRGWGQGLKKCIARWMNDQPADKLAYQMLKYQNRMGWTWHDVLHKCHAKPASPGHQALYRWAKTGEVIEEAPKLLELWKEIQAMPKPGSTNPGPSEAESRLCQMIVDNRLPRELIPTEWLNSPRIWAALLQDMPLTAMIRSLGKMSAVGLIGPNSDSCKLVTDKLNQEYIHKSRVHPMALLLASNVYSAGRGVKGGLTWQPAAKIVTALEEAFHAAFHNVEPTGKKYLLALDVSGSMNGGSVAGTYLTPRKASGAMAMVTVRSEEWVETMAFSSGFVKLGLNKNQSLGDVIQSISRLPFDGTDCSLPMTYARKHEIPVEVFVVYTDSETWQGSIHASEALKQYRKAMGINAKLIVVGMVANRFTIADPNDPGMLDVVGFSADVPQVMSSFARMQA